MRKKILLITPFYLPNLGGAETFAYMVTLSMSKRADVQVLTYEPMDENIRSLDRPINDGVIRLKWPFNPGKTYSGTGIKNFFLTFPKLFIHGLRHKADRIDAHGLNAGLAAVLIKKIKRIPVTVTLLALYEFSRMNVIKKSIARFILKNADKIFVEGKTGQEDVACFGLKTIAFNHWVDQDIFYPKENKHDFTVLFVGRPIPEKGIDIILQTEHQLKSIMRFIYAQNVPWEDLARYYQMADVLIVPSLYSEGFVRVVAEGASCGCVVVTSNKGALPELVRNFGVTTEPTVDNFVYILKLLYSDRHYFNLLKERTIHMAKYLFSPKNADPFLEGL